MRVSIVVLLGASTWMVACATPIVPDDAAHADAAGPSVTDPIWCGPSRFFADSGLRDAGTDADVDAGIDADVDAAGLEDADIDASMLADTSPADGGVDAARDAGNDAVATVRRDPVLGVADLHAHPANHLSYGGSATGFSGMVWGPPHGRRAGVTHDPRDLAYEPYPAEVRADGGIDTTHHPYVVRGYRCEPETHSFEITDPIRRATRSLVLGLISSEGSQYPHTDGDDFRAWPNGRDVLHQQMQIEAIRRAFDGGLRLMVADAGNEQTLAHLMEIETVPGELHLSRDDELRVAIEQLDFITTMAAQNPTWMRIVRSSTEAGDAIRSGHLAIVLGLELDALRIEDVEMLVERFGVRHIVPVHFTDNDVGGSAVYGTGLFNTHNAVMRSLFGASGLDFHSVEPTRRLGYHVDRPTSVAFSPAGILFLPASMPWTDFLALGYDSVPGCCRASVSASIPRDVGARNARGLLGPELLRRMMSLGLLIDLAHMADRTAEEVVTLSQSFEPACQYPLQDSHSGVRWHDGTQHGDERALDQRHWDRLRPTCEATRAPTIFGYGTAGDVALDPTKEQLHWMWQLSSPAQTTTGASCETMGHGLRIGAPGTTCSVGLETAESLARRVLPVTFDVPGETQIEVRWQGRRTDCGDWDGEPLHSCDWDVSTLCEPGMCASGPPPDRDAPASVSFQPRRPSGCEAMPDARDFPWSGASTTTPAPTTQCLPLSHASAPMESLCAYAPTFDAGTGGVLDGGPPDAAVVPPQRLGPILSFGAMRGALTVPLVSAVPSPEQAACLAYGDRLHARTGTRSVRIALTSGASALRSPAYPFEGTHVCAAPTHGGQLVAIVPPAQRGDCPDQFVDVNHGGSWGSMRTLQAIVTIPNEGSEIDGVSLRLVTDDLLVDPLDVVAIDVSGVMDPVLAMWCDFRAHFLRPAGIGAIGTDINGLQPQMAFSDVPLDACGEVQIDARDRATGAHFSASLGPLYIEPLHGAPVRLDFAERGLASYGLLPDLFRALATYDDLAELDPDASVLGGLFHSAQQTIDYWAAIEHVRDTCAY